MTSPYTECLPWTGSLLPAHHRFIFSFILLLLLSVPSFIPFLILSQRSRERCISSRQIKAAGSSNPQTTLVFPLLPVLGCLGDKSPAPAPFTLYFPYSSQGANVLSIINLNGHTKKLRSLGTYLTANERQVWSLNLRLFSLHISFLI